MLLLRTAQVRVLPSQAKNRLYVGNIPRALTHDQLVDILKPFTKGPSQIGFAASRAAGPMSPCQPVAQLQAHTNSH